jgi:hypothetical protein
MPEPLIQTFLRSEALKVLSAVLASAFAASSGPGQPARSPRWAPSAHPAVSSRKSNLPMDSIIACTHHVAAILAPSPGLRKFPLRADVVRRERRPLGLRSQPVSRVPAAMAASGREGQETNIVHDPCSLCGCQPPPIAGTLSHTLSPPARGKVPVAPTGVSCLWQIVSPRNAFIKNRKSVPPTPPRDRGT